MKNPYILLFCWLCLTCTASAQQSTVSGKVVSASDNESLPGVNVLVKGTGQGTVTDVDGNYSISVAEGTLVFSSIGYGTQEVPINGRSTIATY